LFLSVLILAGCKDSKEYIEEGFVEVNGGKVWYRMNGKGPETPLLLLHGGPGSSSFSFDPLTALSEDRPIIFYDQLGSGRSDRISDTSLMTVERYVEEVEQLRKSLELEKVYVYGHSWGTALGLEYYLKYPKHVKGIIFSSPYFSTKRWIKDANKLVKKLPDSVQQIIKINEKNKTFDNPRYKEAVNLFYAKHLRRKERPQSRKDSANMFFGTNVYEYMWGPSEFTATGTLLNYDRIDKLQEVDVPTLFMTGTYDEARPETVKNYQRLVSGSEYVEISEAGHATLNDNQSQTIKAVKRFIDSLDKEETQ